MKDLYINEKIMPKMYIEALDKTREKAINIFASSLCTIALGGSGGKGCIIEAWSDLDIYIILKKYNPEKIINFMNEIKNCNIHIGTTFYTLDEIKNGMIDAKTKVMCYEHYKYNFNPIIYGKDILIKINYQSIIENDKYNLPNILHDFRRKYICLASDKELVLDKTYIKKTLLLVKCLLNCYGTFTYNYENAFSEFKKLVSNEKYNYVHKIKNFDIINVINNMSSSKETVLEFSYYLLDFINKCKLIKGEIR